MQENHSATAPRAEQSSPDQSSIEVILKCEWKYLCAINDCMYDYIEKVNAYCDFFTQLSPDTIKHLLVKSGTQQNIFRLHKLVDLVSDQLDDVLVDFDEPERVEQGWSGLPQITG